MCSPDFVKMLEADILFCKKTVFHVKKSFTQKAQVSGKKRIFKHSSNVVKFLVIPNLKTYKTYNSKQKANLN